jgi:hypothetical protein
MSHQEVDIIPFPFVITPTLMQQMDFTIPLTVEDYHLLQPYPKEESRLTACIKPFSFTVIKLSLFLKRLLLINGLFFLGLVTISPVNCCGDFFYGPIDFLSPSIEINKFHRRL